MEKHICNNCNKREARYRQVTETTDSIFDLKLKKEISNENRDGEVNFYCEKCAEDLGILENI